jgi:hypothetical protein
MVKKLTAHTLELTEEEAFALLGLCMSSPDKLDSHAEEAMHKLADFCKGKSPRGGKQSSQSFGTAI